jgi:hypothetical protein
MRILIALLIIYCCLDGYALNFADYFPEQNSKVLVRTQVPASVGPSELQLKISMKSPLCSIETECKVHVDIVNPSAENIDTEGMLGLSLSQHEESGRRGNDIEIYAPVRIKTLKTATQNEYDSFVLRSKEHIQFELNLTDIRWLKTKSSSINFSELSSLIKQGKYDLNIQFFENPILTGSTRTMPNKIATEAAGLTDVTIVRKESRLKGKSNPLSITFLKSQHRI